jgi:hypothetical protein
MLTYIRQLTDEYRGVVPVNPNAAYIYQRRHIINEYRSHIFIGDVAESMNIWGKSKSNRTTHIFVGIPKYLSI